MIIAIDGDTVAYRAAFAAERTWYVVVDEDGPLREFQYKSQLDKWIKEEGMSSFAIVMKEIRLEPLENALNNVKNILNGIEIFIEKELDGLLLDEFVSKLPVTYVYLSGSDNFRKKLNKFEPYKGKRSRKPTFLPEIREYMENHWSAYSENNLEADDLLAIQSSNSSDVIIVTTDKDMKQIPGWNYNFVTKELVYVTPEDADRFFWVQMLQGDSSDNIRGISGVGPVGAKQRLQDCKNVEQYRQVVYDIYQKSYGDEGHDRFEETFTLLRLLRTRDEVDSITELTS